MTTESPLAAVLASPEFAAALAKDAWDEQAERDRHCPARVAAPQTVLEQRRHRGQGALAQPCGFERAPFLKRRRSRVQALEQVTAIEREHAFERRDRRRIQHQELAGIDVDKPADHKLVEAIIAGEA